MLSTIYQFIGIRKKLPQGFESCVELLAWYHPVYIPSHHLALQVHHGDECHYISFSPISLIGLANQSLFQTRQGRPGYFIDCYADELVIQGIRNSWPDAEALLTDSQKNMVNTQSFAKLSDFELLNLTRNFSENQKAEFREVGKPTEVIKLYSLDVKKIIEKIFYYKAASPNLEWASWSGTSFHPKNSHNCSSIILDLLFEGGLKSSIHSTRDFLTITGGLLGAAYAVIHNESFLTSLTDVALGLLTARCAGGLQEGYTGIQTFLNLVAARDKDSFSSVLGLRIVFTTLSMFIGLIKLGPTVPTLLTLPRDVIQLAHEAKNNEEALYMFSQRAYLNMN